MNSSTSPAARRRPCRPEGGGARAGGWNSSAGWTTLSRSAVSGFADYGSSLRQRRRRGRHGSEPPPSGSMRVQLLLMLTYQQRLVGRMLAAGMVLSLTSLFSFTRAAGNLGRRSPSTRWATCSRWARRASSYRQAVPTWRAARRDVALRGLAARDAHVHLLPALEAAHVRRDLLPALRDGVVLCELPALRTEGAAAVLAGHAVLRRERVLTAVTLTRAEASPSRRRSSPAPSRAPSSRAAAARRRAPP